MFKEHINIITNTIFLPKYKFNKYADKHIYLNIYYIILEYIKILNANFLYLRGICKKKYLSIHSYK